MEKNKNAGSLSRMANPNDHEEAAALLVKDLEKIAGEDPSFTIIGMGEFPYTAAEMAEEIKAKTDVGKKYVNGYVAGATFFNS
jgi:hypothetical protein